jgi:hypothetical protein
MTQLRVAQLSCDTQDSRTHHVSYRSAASLLDYDAVLWEPERALSEYLAASYSSSIVVWSSRSESLFASFWRAQRIGSTTPP